MSRRALSRPRSMLLGAVLCVACDAREITVFDVMPSGGASGASNTSNTAGNGGGAGASAGAAGLGGGGSPSTAAAGTGGTLGGSLAGSAGSYGSAGSSGMGGSNEPPLTPCASPEECLPGWQCEKPGCDVEMGVCRRPPPVFCPPEPSPVCGCDGITYWNDCVRRQIGMTAASVGECSVTACACKIDEDCGQEGAWCAQLVQGSDMCHGDIGACWVLPPQCMPNQGDPPVWQECRPPDAPPAPCVDTCLAIRSGHPHKKRFDQCAP
jgi:hypothetical protein